MHCQCLVDTGTQTKIIIKKNKQTSVITLNLPLYLVRTQILEPKPLREKKKQKHFSACPVPRGLGNPNTNQETHQFLTLNLPLLLVPTQTLEPKPLKPKIFQCIASGSWTWEPKLKFKKKKKERKNISYNP